MKKILAAVFAMIFAASTGVVFAQAKADKAGAKAEAKKDDMKKDDMKKDDMKKDDKKGAKK